MNTHQDNLDFETRKYYNLCKYKIAYPQDCKGCLGYRHSCKLREGYEMELDIANSRQENSGALSRTGLLCKPADTHNLESHIRMADGCTFEIQGGDFVREVK